MTTPLPTQPPAPRPAFTPSPSEPLPHQLLATLAQHRMATTRQLHTLLRPDAQRQTISAPLNRLRREQLLDHVVLPRSNRSRAWYLTPQGARLTREKADAPKHMPEHKDWIRRGMDDGVFLLVGSIRPGQGGALLAKGLTPEALQARVAEDPFVVHDVVTAEVIDIAPNLTDPRLSFLTN